MSAGLRSICIGASGTGKTTLTRQLLELKPKNMPVLIYDINQEFTDYYPVEFVDFDVFLSMLVDEKIKHYYIIIEEATIFFRTRSNEEEMINVLVRARHTGNMIQLNFHSFASVPKGIYNLLDYVIVFKTHDNELSVKQRFDHPMVLQAFNECRVSDDDHIHRLVKLSKFK
jgi:GTPase SAR1 family protein